MSHEISLEKAIEMTTMYRKCKEAILAEPYKGRNILSRCETFERGAFDRLLSQPECVKVRIYYGMDDNELVHAIIVGADQNDRDILPLTAARLVTDEEGVILEDSYRCPDNCPPTSPLNP